MTIPCIILLKLINFSFIFLYCVSIYNFFFQKFIGGKSYNSLIFFGLSKVLTSNYSFDSNTSLSLSLSLSHTHTHTHTHTHILSIICRLWIFWFILIVIAMDYSFECNPSFSYISLLFSHLYFFVSIISKQWII